MKNSNLPNVGANNPVYSAPVCRVLPTEKQRVLCLSQTEIVDEYDGEW